MATNNSIYMTPEPGTKRPIDDTVSPSEVHPGGHIDAPFPLRRKSSLPDLHVHVPSIDTSLPQPEQHHDLVAAIQTALVSPQVVQAITAMIMPSISSSISTHLETNIKPLHAEIIMLRDTIATQQGVISNMAKENYELENNLRKANDTIKDLSDAHDDLEQYGRRNILRFHRVPLDAQQARNTDQVIVNLCNDRLGVTPPLTLSDIDRSHTIGRIDRGVGQIICKFVTWNCKFRVCQFKKNLKNHKSPSFNVFVTEDLTAKRREIVQCLSKAKINNAIHSFWTTDGRVFYKHGEQGTKIQAKDCDQIRHLIPDQISM